MANKYRQGAPFQTVHEAVAEILQDRYVWWHGKPMHPKWMESLQLRVIREAVAKRMMFNAVENQHEFPCELHDQEIAFERKKYETASRALQCLTKNVPNWRTARHENGTPMYSLDGTLLNDEGDRSIFDDVDE
jgi:hypothetical protein